jgi:cytochrome c oxidase subunit 3
MSVEALHGAHKETHGHGHGHAEITDPHEYYAHQYVSRAQSNECYIVGMWSFLVTEVMFFGALFIAYIVYRMKYGTEFAEVSREHLNTGLGFVNTLILLTSSLTMALGVRAAQLKNKKGQLAFIGLTICFAFGFLVVKYFEYGAKIQHHLVPGAGFRYEYKGMSVSSAGPSPAAVDVTGISGSNTAGASLVPFAKETDPEEIRNRADAVQMAQKAEVFLGLYFIMTGLHGIHVVLGILVLGILWVMINSDYPPLKDFIPVEMAGLYWHFVDIVWIFLYPVLYLIHPSMEMFIKQITFQG